MENADRPLDEAPKAKTKVVLAGLLSFLMVALFGLLQFDDMRLGQQTVSAIEASNLRLRTISNYLHLLQDIETGQRG